MGLCLLFGMMSPAAAVSAGTPVRGEVAASDPVTGDASAPEGGTTAVPPALALSPGDLVAGFGLGARRSGLPPEVTGAGTGSGLEIAAEGVATPTATAPGALWAILLGQQFTRYVPGTAGWDLTFNVVGDGWSSARPALVSVVVTIDGRPYPATQAVFRDAAWARLSGRLTQADVAEVVKTQEAELSGRPPDRTTLPRLEALAETLRSVTDKVAPATLRLEGTGNLPSGQHRVGLTLTYMADTQLVRLSSQVQLLVAAVPIADGWYPADLHLHSDFSEEPTLHLIKPDEIFANLAFRGYSIGYMTEHTSALNQNQYFDDMNGPYPRACRAANGPTTSLFPGVEVAVDANLLDESGPVYQRDGHALGFGVTSAAGLPDNCLSPQTVLDNISANSPISSAAIAHPAHWFYRWFDPLVTNYRGIELMSGSESYFALDSAHVQFWRGQCLRSLAAGSSFLPSVRTGSDYHGGTFESYVTHILIPPDLVWSEATWDDRWGAVNLALKNGRTVASQKGSLAYFTLDGAPVGSSLPRAAGSALTVDISFRPVADGAYTLTLYRDDCAEAVWTTSLSTLAGSTHSWTTQYTFGGGRHYYWLYVEGSDYCYTTPVYVAWEQSWSLTLAPSSVELLQGGTLAVTATASMGIPVDVTAVAVWTSSNPSVFTVARGIVTAVAPGDAQLAVTYGPLLATAPVRVTKVGTVLLTAAGWSMPVGTWDSATKTATLGQDLAASIEIRGSGITLDGAGHTLTGSGSGVGVCVPGGLGSGHITVKNLTVTGFSDGVGVWEASYGTYTNITASDNRWEGFVFWRSSNNTIVSNTADRNGGNGFAIVIDMGVGTGNTVTNNTSSGNGRDGYGVGDNNLLTFTGNMAIGNAGGGLGISHCTDCTITDNSLSSNAQTGMTIHESTRCTLSGNAMSGNGRGFNLNGLVESHYDHSIDVSNRIDGRPIYYVTGGSGQTIDASSDAAVVYLINCTNMTVRDLSFARCAPAVMLYRTSNSTIERVSASDGMVVALGSSNGNTIRNCTGYKAPFYLSQSPGNKIVGCTATGQPDHSFGIGFSIFRSDGTIMEGNVVTSTGRHGIVIDRCGNNRLTGNLVQGCDIGFQFSDACNNLVTGNTARNNSTGVLLEEITTGQPGSSNNILYGNNFISNSCYVTAFSTGNVWNLPAPIGGNYWSGWAGPDANLDGFVDYPYVFQGGQDNLPLAVPVGWVDIVLTPTGDSASATEGGPGGTYTIALASQPPEDITVTLTCDDQVAVALEGGGSTLLFTPRNWSIPRTVSVIAVDDDAVEGPHTGVITHSVSRPVYGIISESKLTVSITDNDTPCLVISEPAPPQVTEGGHASTYTIALGARPIGPVTIALTGDGRVAATGDTGGTSLVFSVADWSAPRVVTLTAVDDAVVEGPHTGYITHTASGSGWEGMTPVLLAVGVIDNDLPGVTVAESGGSTSVVEGGATDTYTVALTAQPLTNVTVTATTDGKTTVNGVTSTSLVFTPASWNSPRTVTVRAVDDRAIEGTHASTITHSAAGGGFDGISTPSVTVTVGDNDPLPPPTGLKATSAAEGFNLVWNSPAGVAPPTGYEVHISTAATGSFTKVKDVVAAAGTAQNCGLTATECAAVQVALVGGQTYYVRVKSSLDLGGGQVVFSLPSNTASAVAGPIPPLAPRSLTGAATATGLRLGWLPPLTGCVPQGYQVFIAPTATGPFTLVKEVTSWTGTAPNCEVTQLDFADGAGGYTFTLAGGKRYAFQVRGFILPSVGGTLLSKASNTATVTTGPLPPPAPTGLAARTTLLGVGLGWKPPLPTATAPTPPTGYSVYIAATSAGPWTFVKDVTTWTGDLPNTEVTGADLAGTGFTMTGGLRYSFRVFSFLTHPLTGQKVPSLMGATTTGIAGPLPPLAPTSLRGTTGADGFGLTWVPPLTGVTPQGYEVRMRPAAATTAQFVLVKDVLDGSWSTAMPSCGVTSAEIAAGGLAYTPGARYSVRLYAYALHPVTMEKLVSARWASSTVTAGPLPPQAPTGLVGTTALPASGGGVNLTWKPPTMGAVPAGYAVHIAAVSTGPYTFVRNVTSWPGTYPSTQVTAGDCSAVGFPMTAGVRYYFRVYSFIYHPVTLAEIPSLRFGVTSAIAGALP